MVKIEVTKTELVWLATHTEDGMCKAMPRVSLPVRAVETVNASRARREAKKRSQITPFDLAVPVGDRCRPGDGEGEGRPLSRQ